MKIVLSYNHETGNVIATEGIPENIEDRNVYIMTLSRPLRRCIINMIEVYKKGMYEMTQELKKQKKIPEGKLELELGFQEIE